MGGSRDRERRSLQDGMKAVSGSAGRGDPKIGVAEFMSIAERFGFSQGTLVAVRTAVEAEDWGAGPFLANYYSGLEQTKVQLYEQAACELLGSSYAIATSSGSGALHAAFTAIGVGPGTEVICPAIGFVATASAVVMARGVPVFCDVDESQGMDPSKLEALITPRTVAIAPTHVMGAVCDMDPIMRTAESHGLRVVEDTAQSAGARYKGRFAGTIGLLCHLLRFGRRDLP